MKKGFLRIHAEMTNQLLVTLGGRVECTQCNATSKRTKERCRAPAESGNNGYSIYVDSTLSGNIIDVNEPLSFENLGEASFQDIVAH